MRNLLGSLERAARLASDSAARLASERAAWPALERPQAPGAARPADRDRRSRRCFPDSAAAAAPSDGCVPAKPAAGDNCFPNSARG